MESAIAHLVFYGFVVMFLLEISISLGRKLRLYLSMTRNQRLLYRLDGMIDKKRQGGKSMGKTVKEEKKPKPKKK